MLESRIAAWSVFTKPWRHMEPSRLAALVRRMGFDGVELPVRDGFQVQPGDPSSRLRKVADIFQDHGLRIYSVAGAPTEELFVACAESGVPQIRIMIPVSDDGFTATGRLVRDELNDIASRSSKYPVRVIVQPHFGYFVSNSVDLANLLKDYDPESIGAIWDAAHEALAGRAPEHGLESLWRWLSLVNFKNVYYRRTNAEGSQKVEWKPYFTDGPDGMAQWGRAIRYLVEHSYSGPICLTAEYTDETDLESRVTHDLKFAQSLVKESL